MYPNISKLFEEYRKCATLDTKNHPLMWPKNMWKRIPHLMQQHETPRKGRSTDNLQELIKSKT